MDYVRLVAQPGSTYRRLEDNKVGLEFARADRPDVIPTKPDIVMEGGNFVVDEDNAYCPSPQHFVLTTSSAGNGKPLALVGAECGNCSGSRG